MKKKYIISFVALLLSLTASAAKRQGTVTLMQADADGLSAPLNAVATFDDATHTATLGNGYNACISHYEEGNISIPGTCESEGVTYTVDVGPLAFRFCNHLTTVIVGEGVTKIGAYAFVGCASLTSVRLPSTLVSIGSGAFSELSSLKTMACYATTPVAWEWNDVFSPLGTQASMAGMAAERTLYVPESAYDDYKDYLFDGTSTDAQERVGWQHAFKHIYGFSTDPVPISSAEELAAFRDAVNNGEAYLNNPDQSVVLTADIDLSSVGNWTSIGTSEHPFAGTFNGGGHVIKGLIANSAGSNGLFGVTEGANIYHFHLLNPEIFTAEIAGTVAGTANNTRISDVLVTSNASGLDYTVRAYQAAGGIVGASNASTTIERCLFRGRITGAHAAGGIVGIGLQGLTITDCSADNYIENARGLSVAAGGIVGLTSRASITHCFARNEFATATVKGAIVGKLNNTETSTTLITDISNCAYWQSIVPLNPVGSTGDKTSLIEPLPNTAYTTEANMIGNATRTRLGDNWHYFAASEGFYDYPIPETLTDMYLRGVKYDTDANGLVYSPIETSEGIQSYKVVGNTGTAETLAIPQTFKEKPVTSIGDDAFNGNTFVKNMTIGDNVQEIGNRAFYGSVIETLTLSQNLETIGNSAFEDCDALLQVELPDNVSSVGTRAFCDCDNLTSFGIGYKFARHDGNFLAYCHKLSHLYIRENGNDNGFRCEDNVLIHYVGGNLTAYFVACAPGKTGDFTLTSTLPRINVLGECFEGCSGLTGITFSPDQTYWVGERAFSGATNLRYIDMSSVPGIREGEGNFPLYYDVDRQNEDDPFYGTSNSTIIYLPSDHSAEDDEPNVVIGGTANRLLLTDGWDFTPPVDITATNGVTYDRTFTATRTEVTQSTGNTITVTDDETGETTVFDELEVTGYTYPPTGYSVCLPYALTITSDSIKVYEPKSIVTPEGGTGERLNVIFTEVPGKAMEAYKPYYITVRGDEKYDLNTTTTTFVPRAPELTPWQSQHIEFKGTTTVISNADLGSDATRPAYILQDDGNWHRVAADTEEAYVPTFRAYFQATEATQTLQLVTIINLQGDVNLDGQVTIADITTLVNIVLGKQTDVAAAADINQDGQVTIADVTALLKIILGKDSE